MKVGRLGIADRSWAAPAAAFLALLLGIWLLSAPGAPSAAAAFATVAQVWIESGGVAIAWLLGAIGLGRIARPLLGAPAPGAWTIQLGVGVAVMLWLSHALGALGVFSGPLAMLMAWAPVTLGLIAFVEQIRHRENRPDLWGAVPLSALLALPAVAALLVSACSPPGALWVSEARGYDTLSYHLQLPREWLERGAIAPLAHNVYSFFPSYVEAAYTHLGAMLGAGASAFTSDAAPGIFAAHCLHALLTIAAAAAIGRLIALLTRDAGAGPGAQGVAAGLGAAALLSAPWTVVVGSMAYNEMAVALALTASLIVARQPGLKPTPRGAIIGVLMAGAVGAKLTAAYMAVPVAACSIGFWTPRRGWLPAFAAASVAGLIGLAPWLLRNAPHGNPFFPFATSLLGQAHWTAEQAMRWNSAHHVAAGPLERLALLASAQRGVLHPQWFIFFPLGVVFGVLALAVLRFRRSAAALVVMGGLQLLLWMSFGHLQSRFLAPAAPVFAVLFGLGIAAGVWRPRRAKRVATLALGALGVGALSAATVLNFLAQNDGRPNGALVGGAGAFNGALAAGALPRLNPAERREALDVLPPAAIVNLAFARQLSLRNVGTSARPLIYLFGDATPLYMQVPVLYHTTWDASPLADLLRAHDGDLPRAIAGLRALGVTHVLVNLNEVARLHADGWSDPLLTLEFAARVIESGVVVWTWTAPGAAGPLDTTGLPGPLAAALVDITRDAPQAAPLPR